MSFLQIIGNLIYYRFINSAICSPDVYDIIDLKAGCPLDSDQRKNLACIAKHLQLISMSKGVRIKELFETFDILSEPYLINFFSAVYVNSMVTRRMPICHVWIRSLKSHMKPFEITFTRYAMWARRTNTLELTSTVIWSFLPSPLCTWPFKKYVKLIRYV